MRHGCQVETNAVLGRIPCQCPLCKIRAIVSDDAVWNAISADDVGHELDCSRTIQLLDRTSFYPFGELVYGHQKMCYATSGRLELTNHIQTPNCEWPCNRYSLQC